MHIPFTVPACRIERVVEQDPDRIVIRMRRRGANGRSPDCGRTSRSIHSRYHRHPADLPLAASRTALRIEVRRFYCCNPSCNRRTFAEPPFELLGLRARRTRRLAEAQGRIGIACGGAGGSRRFQDVQRHLGLALGGAPAARLAHRLAIPASPSTFLRMVRAGPAPISMPPRVIAIDEWAWRRGRRYGTIIVDLERNAIADLLPDRDSDTVADWLRRHPGVEIVARDRAEVYGEGVRQGAPGAVHVLENHRTTSMTYVFAVLF